MLKDVLLNEVFNIKDTIINNRRYLHSHAEIGFNLHKTKAYVSKQLTSYGYNVIECGKCGLYVEAGKGNPVFLLRCDMDALPIKEETDIDFKSEKNMHACGHDMHTSMLLGAAYILKKHEDELKGTVRMMFQPSEETFEGALDMINNGVLKDVEGALMMHVVSGTYGKTGSVMVSGGGVNAPAADVFSIDITGKGCHGSTPHLGRDALSAAARILLGLEEISARELSYSDEAILTIGMVHGGDAPNAIAGSCSMKGTIRSFDEDIREYMKSRMCEIVKGIASAYRCEADVSFVSGCPTLKNDEFLSEFVCRNTRELLGDDNVIALADSKIPVRLGGSEDFAYISQRVPAIALTLNCGHIDDGYMYPLHHPNVKFDEDALVYGCMTYVYNAIKYVNK